MWRNYGKNAPSFQQNFEKVSSEIKIFLRSCPLATPIQHIIYLISIKSQKKYGTVEKSIKDYILKLQNIYKELESANEMNPNTIFNAENIKNNYG